MTCHHADHDSTIIPPIHLKGRTIRNNRRGGGNFRCKNFFLVLLVFRIFFSGAQALQRQKKFSKKPKGKRVAMGGNRVINSGGKD